VAGNLQFIDALADGLEHAAIAVERSHYAGRPVAIIRQITLRELRDGAVVVWLVV